MYSRSAEFYDLLYAGTGKKYEEEAGKLTSIIDRYFRSARSILDVACGTGEHDRFLKARFEVHGLDLNQRFVDIARNKNPECTYHRGDMRDFRIGKRFDAVVCLFSAIGFLPSPQDLVRTICCMKEHLAPGGIIVIEPWFTPETWIPEAWPLHMATYETPDIKYVRVSRSDVEGRFSLLHMHHVYADRNRFEHFEERGRLYLFDMSDFRAAFNQAGMAMEYDPEGLTGRGIYVGVS